MSSSRDRFLDLMKNEILKLDLADLDFGIYRILNYRRAEIEAFFDKALPAALDEAMTGEGDESAFVQSEEDRLYNALFTFFSRYYRDGDFQPQQRRARDARYSVPYNGEDVHFHWRSKGSHYIKTTEELKSYSFRSGNWRVRFELRDAFQEPDNVKGTTRYFIPEPDMCRTDVGDEGNLFVMPFEFRKLKADESKRYGKRIGGVSTQELLINELADEVEPPNGVAKTDLLHHMQRYARKNRTDYFVHPHLGEFLRGELDFYLKNEFLDIEALTSTDAIADRLMKMRAVHEVANRIIDMLDEIESFQARLFTKRRFVLNHGYLVAVGSIPKGLWATIVECETQIAQWQADQIVSGPISVDTLVDNPSLVVDTSLFAPSFQATLLAHLDDVDEAIDGLLVSSENFGALRTLQNTLSGNVAAIYIDPPYNTGSDGFLYRDDFSLHSSWLAMMADRIAIGAGLLGDGGTLMFSCDDNEQHHARMLADSTLGPDAFMTNLVWKSRQNVDSRTDDNVSNDHEFVLVYGDKVRGAAKDLSKYRNPDDDPRGPWMSDNMVGLATRARRPNLHFKLLVGQIEQMDDETITVDGEKRFDIDPQRRFGATPKVGDLVLICLTLESQPSASPASSTVLAEGNVPLPQDSRIVHRGEYACPNKGWRFDPASMVRRVSENRIIWPASPTGRPRKKTYLRELASDFTGFSSYVGYTANGTKQAQAVLGKDAAFAFPKSVDLIKTLVEQTVLPGQVVLDYFAGSGTTGEAVIRLNVLDGGRRRFVLVDFAEYFSELLVPRIRRLMQWPSWQDGAPAELTGQPSDWAERSPTMIQVLTLESYEDSLNSLVVGGDDQLGSGHRVRYGIADSVDDSPVLLATERLEDPFDYQLEVHTDEGVEYRNVELVTTFNLIKGIRMKRYRELDHVGRRYVVVEGVDSGKTVLVLWRSITGLDPEAEVAFLNEAIPEALGVELGGYDVIWHNADSAIPKSMSLDAEFKRLMFEPEPALS